MTTIIGTGHAVPAQVVTNNDLTKFMETSDEWIAQRSGIRERRWARRGFEPTGECSNADLAYRASAMALDSAKLKASDLDGVVYCTISPDQDFPGSGAALLNQLRLESGLPLFEVRNHCAGFITGLAIARSYLTSGKWRRALVVGVELQSSGLNLSTEGRGTTVLFGDGAGAVVLEDRGAQSGVLELVLGADGTFAESLGVVAPTFARTPFLSAGDFSGKEAPAYPRMEGVVVFKAASQKMPELVREVLTRQNKTLADLALIIPHQANQRILDMLGQALECPEKVYSHIAKYGNTTAATIPLALSEAVIEGRVKTGDLICLVTFGAGFAWGASLIRWG